MIDILYAILPIFLAIGMGSLVERLGFLPASAAPALNAYSIRVAWPIMAVYIMSGAEPADLFQGKLWAAFLSAHFVIYAAAYFGDLRLMRRGRGPAVITAVSASSGMSAFVSLPIILNLLPGRQEALIMGGLLALSPTFTLAVALVQLDLQRRSEGAAPGGRGALLRLIFVNPLILGLLVGALLCLCGIQMWAPLRSAVALIADSAAPCGLMAVGLSCRGQMSLVLQNISLRSIGYQAALSGVKMLLLPLCVWLFLALAGVSGVPLFAAVMLSCSGVAVGAFVIAGTYGHIPEDCAAALLISNLLSIFTLAGFAYLFIEVLHLV